MPERRGNFSEESKVENFPLYSEKFPDLKPGEKTRDYAARKAGFGNRETYRQFKESASAAASHAAGAHTLSHVLGACLSGRT